MANPSVWELPQPISSSEPEEQLTNDGWSTETSIALSNMEHLTEDSSNTKEFLEGSDTDSDTAGIAERETITDDRSNAGSSNSTEWELLEKAHQEEPRAAGEDQADCQMEINGSGDELETVLQESEPQESEFNLEDQQQRLRFKRRYARSPSFRAKWDAVYLMISKAYGEYEEERSHSGFSEIEEYPWDIEIERLKAIVEEQGNHEWEMRRRARNLEEENEALKAEIWNYTHPDWTPEKQLLLVLDQG